MFKYNKLKNELTCYKVDNVNIDMDLLNDQKEAYQNYLNNVVKDDVEELVKDLCKFAVEGNVTATTRVLPLAQSSYAKDIKKQCNSYYPVEVTFKYGIRTTPPIVLLEIPHMDSFCKLNVKGKRKVLVIEQRPSEDISYDEAKSVLNITMPRANIGIFASKKGIKVRHSGNKREPLDLIVRAMLYKEGIKLTNYNGEEICLSDYLSNGYLSGTINANKYAVDKLIYDKISKLNILEKYDSEQYALGETREALNTFLTIDACLMQTLSRSVGGYDAGTKVTEEILKDLKKKRVNEVYIKDLPAIDGMYLCNEKPIIYDVIPAGTKNCTFLMEAFPEYKNLAYIKEDIHLDPNNPLYIEDGTRLTKEDLEFMFIMGEEEITCKRTKSSEPIKFKFEAEIIGNYTAKLKDLIGVIPEDRNADEWIYYYNNPNLEPRDMSHLKAHDMLAILSLLGRIYTTNYNPLLNRDTSFLKKVVMADSTFSEHFRKVSPLFCNKYRRAITGFLSGQYDKNPFYSFTREWIASMQEARVLAEADTLNVAAEVAQVTHITTITQNKNSVAEEQRQLAIPFYGRLCPYETPAGQKLGLVNTKAIGAKVRDSKLVTPFRRVKKTSNGISLSNIPTYLSVKEEMQYRIGDILSLRKDENGNYINNKVIARIPNPSDTGDRIIFDECNAYDLDYVNAHTEQYLSPTAAMMPFLCSNDAVRVSYGLNMIRQCIYILFSEIPRVRTFMYEDIYKYSNAFLVKAPKDGMVLSIGANYVLLAYDDGTEEEISVPETRITNESVIFLNYRVATNERFKAGDILVDSTVSKNGVFSPARDVLAGYIMTGWNYEDAVHSCEYMSAKYVSIDSKSVERTIPRSSGKSMTIGSANKFKYVSRGAVVTNLSVLDHNDDEKKRPEPIRTKNESGLFYDTDKIVEDNGDITYRCYLLQFNKLQRGDKMAGRHGNKGVISLIDKNSNMPMLNNGYFLNLLLNPCGVPSRMNLGQIDEIHAGLVAHVLDTYIISDPFNGASMEDLKLLMSYTYRLANCSGEAEARRIQLDFPQLPQEFHEHCIEVLSEIMDWAGAFYEDGSADLWDPVTGTYYEDRVLIGYTHFLKLEHEAEHKLHVRAGMLEEMYNEVSKQPPKGARKGGGQKFGEMELIAVAAYGAMALLDEIMNGRCDNIGERANIHLEALDYDARVPKEYCTSRAVETLLYDLEVLNVHTDIDTDELNKVDLQTSMNKFTYDVRTLIRNKVIASDSVVGKTNDELLKELNDLC